MSVGTYSSHVNGEPHEIHNGAASLDSWVITNRGRNNGYLLLWDATEGNVTPGVTVPAHIIPVTDKSEFAPKTNIGFSTAITVGFFTDRDGNQPADSDVLIEYTV